MMAANGTIISVILFRNDGRLEALEAVPMQLNQVASWAAVKAHCFQAVYGYHAPNPRLFSELGVELPSFDFIVPLQSIVVSGGEPFVPTSLAGKLPEEAPGEADVLDHFLANLYAGDLDAVTQDTKMMQSYLVQADQNMQLNTHQTLMSASQAMFSELFAAPPAPVNDKLQNIFDGINFPTISIPESKSPSDRWSTGSVDGGMASPPGNVQQVPSSLSPMPSANELQGPPSIASPGAFGVPMPSHHPQRSSVTNGAARFSPYHAFPQPPAPAPAPIASAMGMHRPSVSDQMSAHPSFSATTTTSLYAAPSPSVASSSSSPPNGSQQPGASKDIDKADAHKASEMRSRNKLKESIRELVMSVPTLRHEKNPSKAVIIKKASEYVNASRSANDRLVEENNRYKEQIAQLQMERLKLQHEKQLSSIVTVEVVSLDVRYLFVDHMWEIMMGYTRAEVVGQFIKEVIGCRTCPLMAARCKAISDSVQANQVWHGLVLGQRKDGRTFACEATVTPMVNEKGEPFQFIMVRKNFHFINNVECRTICAGLMEEPFVNTLDMTIEHARKALAESSLEGLARTADATEPGSQQPRQPIMQSAM